MEPHVFASVTIHSTERNMESILKFLPNLASGATPHVRWAKQLWLDNLVPVSEDRMLVDRLTPGPNRERLLACQNKWLVPAMRSLTRVEEVERVPSLKHSQVDADLCSM